MPAPTQDSIRQSLSLLQQGKPLFQKDMFNIAWGFTFHPEQDRMLLEIQAHNEKLAESLMIYRKIFVRAAAEGNLESAIDRFYLHYVVNTDGLIPEAEGEDYFDVFEASVRYGDTLCIGVSKGENDISVLHVNGKVEECRKWDALPDWSAAWSLRRVGPVINRARYGRNDVIPSTAFGFDEQAEDHRLHNAMAMADFSSLAYFQPVFVEKQLKQWGYHTFCWVEDIDSDTQAFVAAKENHVVLSFRGTSSGTDALVDLKIRKTDAFGGRGRVHRGFHHALESVWEKVKREVSGAGAGKKLFVCGHSLGAALAQLAAHRLDLEGFPVAGVYVFGSPRVGNREFAEAYNGRLKEKTFLHINHKDIVTQVPPTLLGFQHLGGPPRVFNRGHVISMPDVEQADEGQELRFEDLDENSREAIQRDLDRVRESLDATTLFLRTPPDQLQAGSYGAVFESGMADDHGIEQYLFKLGCAIVDGEWQRMKKALS